MRCWQRSKTRSVLLSPGTAIKHFRTVHHSSTNWTITLKLLLTCNISICNMTWSFEIKERLFHLINLPIASICKMNDDIPFPFPPYPQQRDLMKSISLCTESSFVGCFESPTDTGKSISDLCATLSWQFKEEERILEEQLVLASKRNSASSDGLWRFKRDLSLTLRSSTRQEKHTTCIWLWNLESGVPWCSIKKGHSLFGKFGSTKVRHNSNNTFNAPTVSTI